jgi:hypothetical protein
LDRLLGAETLVFRRPYDDLHHFVVLDVYRSLLLAILQTSEMESYWRDPHLPLGFQPLSFIRGMSYELLNPKGALVANVIGPRGPRGRVVITGSDGIEVGAIAGSRPLQVSIEDQAVGTMFGRHLVNDLGEVVATATATYRGHQRQVEHTVTVQRPEYRGLARMAIALPLVGVPDVGFPFG